MLCWDAVSESIYYDSYKTSGAHDTGISNVVVSWNLVGYLKVCYDNLKIGIFGETNMMIFLIIFFNCHVVARGLPSFVMYFQVYFIFHDFSSMWDDVLAHMNPGSLKRKIYGCMRENFRS